MATRILNSGQRAMGEGGIVNQILLTVFLHYAPYLVTRVHAKKESKKISNKDANISLQLNSQYGKNIHQLESNRKFSPISYGKGRALCRAAA